MLRGANYLDDSMKKYYWAQQAGGYRTITEAEKCIISIYDAFNQEDPSHFIEKNKEKFDLQYNPDESDLRVEADIDIGFSPILLLSEALTESISGLSGFNQLRRVEIHLPREDLLAFYLEDTIPAGLNLELSDYDKYEKGLVVFKHVLNSENLQEKDILRISESPLKIFFSSEFVNIFQKNRFKGADFKEVMTS